MQEVRRVDGAANRPRAPSRGRRALLPVPALLFRCQGDPQSTGNCHAEVELILPGTLQTTQPTKAPRTAQPRAYTAPSNPKSVTRAPSNFRDLSLQNPRLFGVSPTPSALFHRRFRYSSRPANLLTGRG